MSLSGARSPRWIFMLLDRADRPLGRIDGVTGGSGEVVAQARLGGSASLTIDNRGQHINWQADRVQVTYDPGIPGVEPWPKGVYLFTSPREIHTEFGVTFDVGLLTKMAVIDEDTVEARFSIAPGVPVTPIVRSLVESTGEYRISVTDSTATLTSGLTFDAGTSKLTIINELLGAIGYWSLWCDLSGTFRVQPYVDPELRPISYTFRHGDKSVHMPEWDREQDQSSVPNRFIAVGEGDDESEPLVGVALNENPDSPYSFQARGRWITETEEGVEGDSQSTFDQYAMRRLRGLMNPVARMSATHAVLPLDQNDLVEFIPEDGIRRLATVQRMSNDFSSDADSKVEWREVIPI